jgi:transposase
MKEMAMPRKRLSMRQVHDVLRLKWAGGLSDRQIAQSLGLSRPTVAAYVHRAQAAGLTWPLPETLDETALEQLLFPTPATLRTGSPLAPDWAHVHRELTRKGVTLWLLWQEYKATAPDGFQYSWFCQGYRAWASKLDLVMRQSHRAGEKLFVDYAGQTLPIVNNHSGEVHEAQVFIAVLGASNYTYVEATWTQSLPDWIGSHVRTFAALGGVPEIVVPDNLKAAVTKAHRYEPEINRTYADLAHHYGVAIIPARAARPRDKAKAEVGVQVVERWILAALRHQTFFTLAEANAAIAGLLPALNARPFKKLPGSRQSLFASIDRPALRSLPDHPYVYAEWKHARVNIDYHVDVEGHYYSVPYVLVRQQLDVRVTSQVVELFHKNTRVASHHRSPLKGRHSTVAAHMPTAHQRYAEWTPQRLIDWAATSGVATSRVVEKILESRPHPQQGFRSCLGIMRLGKSYGAERLEAACRRALQIGACSYKSLESILKQGLDHQPVPPPPATTLVVQHDNIRGALYYQSSLQENDHATPSDTRQTPDAAPKRDVSRPAGADDHA